MFQLPHKQFVRKDKARRRGLAWLGVLSCGFLGMSHVANQRHIDQNVVETMPRFALDVNSASEAELRLLPNVGEKTAKRWAEARSQPDFSTPKSVADLETLPHVGPKRAEQLAPHLLETNR